MRRKIVQQGPSTLMISIPHRWAQRNNLQKGEEMEMIEEEGRLILARNTPASRPKKAVLNLDSLNEMTIKRYLHEFYRQGVEEIVLTFTKEELPDYKHGGTVPLSSHIRKLTERFIGMEIISQTDKRIVLESFMNQEDEKKMELVQSRIFYLIQDFLNQFLESMDKDFAVFYTKFYDYHDNIAKFLSYYLRLLHTSREQDDAIKSRLFGIYIIIDKCIDKVRHLSEHFAKIKNPSKNLKESIKETFSIFLAMFALLKESTSAQKMDTIVQKRYRIVNDITNQKFKLEESQAIAQIRLLLDAIPDFCETYVALHIHKYIEDEPC